MIADDADALNEQADADTDVGTEGTEGQAAAQAKAVASPEGKAAEGDGKGGVKTIAEGDTEVDGKAKEEPKAKSYWPEDWRETAAKHLSAGDEKAYAKELKRLQRFANPEAVAGSQRETERLLSSGGLVKLPGKDAKPEEIAEFNKALGVPDDPKGYTEHIKLENGAVIGEADKPFVDSFISDMHKAGARPADVNAGLNWYYKLQEERAAQVDEEDDNFRAASERAIKEEWGNSFKRRTNAIGSMFATAPGGNDIKNANSLFARLMGGRMADGKIIGNDPDFLRLIDSWREEVNPAASVVEDGKQRGMTIDQELDDLRKLRTTDRRKYWSKDVQEREAALYKAKEKMQAKGA